MPYEEPIRRDGSPTVLKNNHQEELGRRGQRNGQKKQQSGKKGAIEKEQHNHEKELGIFYFFKAKEKAIKVQICRERSNNAMLKRTQKRKQ